jgi:hypothetical protein
MSVLWTEASLHISRLFVRIGLMPRYRSTRRSEDLSGNANTFCVSIQVFHERQSHV